MTATVSPGTTAGGRGRIVPRRQIEAHLKLHFPEMSNSQVNKIARRHMDVETATQEAQSRAQGSVPDLLRGAYVGFDPTGRTAVANLTRRGGR